mmetsp:Transcript_3866/g.16660  ORF Transcript_3866/g.16660 Transcript_3866/m.16660 type:complete len:292 (-) Transcript_3866:369-1244(-)
MPLKIITRTNSISTGAFHGLPESIACTDLALRSPVAAAAGGKRICSSCLRTRDLIRGQKGWDENMSGMTPKKKEDRASEGYDIYSRLPSILRPPGFPRIDEKEEGLGDLLSKLLDRRQGSAEAILTSKLRDKTLNLHNPLLNSGKAGGVDHKGTSRRRGKRRRLRSGGVADEDLTFSNAQKLNGIWRSYAEEALQVVETEIRCDDEADFDLHGAPLKIIKCLDPGLVGVDGLVIVETANTVRIISKDSRVRTVPKSGTRALMSLPDRSLHITMRNSRPRQRSQKRNKLRSS